MEQVRIARGGAEKERERRLHWQDERCTSLGWARGLGVACPGG